MPKKRKNSGKNRSGKDDSIQCSKCGRIVPKSKAKRVTRRTNLMEGVIYKELRQTGTIMPSSSASKWYCVSCAVHTHTLKIRSNDERKNKDRL